MMLRLGSFLARSLFLSVLLAIARTQGDGDEPGNQDDERPDEFVVICQYNEDDDEVDRAIHDAADALIAELREDGNDVGSVVLGRDRAAEGGIDHFDDLKQYLQDSGWTGLDSFHLLSHGSPGQIWLPGTNDTYIDKVRNPGPNGRTIGQFAEFLDCVMDEEGEVYLESCNSATPEGDMDDEDDSIAQCVANAVGRQVHGHTDDVIFETGRPPHPTRGGRRVPRVPSRPTVEWFWALEIEGGGQRYQWSVNPNFNQDVCDIHIKLPMNLSTSCIQNFCVQQPFSANKTDGWKGSVVIQDEMTYLTWYNPDCDNPITRRTDITVDCNDTEAGIGDELSTADVVLTMDGNPTLAASGSDIVPFGNGHTKIPEFVSILGDINQDGTVTCDDVEFLQVAITEAQETGLVCANELVFLPNADLDCNGCVDEVDSSLLAETMCTVPVPDSTIEDALDGEVDYLLSKAGDITPCKPPGPGLVEAVTILAMNAINQTCLGYLSVMDQVLSDAFTSSSSWRSSSGKYSKAHKVRSYKSKKHKKHVRKGQRNKRGHSRKHSPDDDSDSESDALPRLPPAEALSQLATVGAGAVLAHQHLWNRKMERLGVIYSLESTTVYSSTELISTQIDECTTTLKQQMSDGINLLNNSHRKHALHIL